MAKTRVLYIGSAVPLDTVAGLDAIQGPLKERYPENDESSIEGIDAWLSVTNSYIQMQYVNDSDQIVQFPISSLTLCAAVRCVSTVNTATGEKGTKFVSLNDPMAGGVNSKRPAIFTAITRRTQGRKVLECHGFICSSPKDALNLVKCASIAGQNYKQNGTIKSNKPTYQKINTNVNGTTDPLLDSGSTLNRLSNGPSAFTPPAATQNGVSNGAQMRLIPGEPIAHVTAGPEFFEPVSTQGYFYSSNNAEVRKYNIAKLGRDHNKENVDLTQSAPSEHQAPTMTPVNGYTPIPTPRPAPVRVAPAPAPIYVRLPRQQYVAPPPMPPPPMAMFYRPPPPPIYSRPRFFSPPPPRFRPQPYMMPPGPPPPMMAAPIFVRRPREGSAGSRSRSDSLGSKGSQRSRDSRSKTPTGQVNNDETRPKRIPNADESSEESEIRGINRQRPSTPPTDYDDRRKGERMSRRDTYEVKYGVQPHPQRFGPPPGVIPPYGYDYYVHPPRHGGYAPFTMYNPHGRSRSVPGFDRQRSKSPRRKKGKKKNKKAKKNKQRQQSQYVYHPRDGFRRMPPENSDVSTDSFAGYHSEIPRGSRRAADPISGYQFYPPRDFRRDENQYMNERNFSKSIKEETRRSRDSKSYPTAYELNDALNRSAADRNEEPDFTMY